jgi:AP2 domain/HNH endonuclease
MEIQISGKHGEGKVLIIDDEDLALLQDKSVFMTGGSRRESYMYPNIWLNGANMAVHKIVAEAMGLKGEIDHENRNRCDSRRKNLREATARQNQRNQGLATHNTSGLKGVSFHKVAGRWCSRIMVNGRKEWLGYFNCPFEAARAYDRRALEVDPIHAATNLSLGLLPESPNFLLSKP